MKALISDSGISYFHVQSRLIPLGTPRQNRHVRCLRTRGQTPRSAAPGRSPLSIGLETSDDLHVRSKSGGEPRGSRTITNRFDSSVARSSSSLRPGQHERVTGGFARPTDVSSYDQSRTIVHLVQQDRKDEHCEALHLARS